MRRRQDHTDRRIDWLLKHPRHALVFICEYYRLNEIQLLKYKNSLLWNYIIVNEQIRWEYALIRFFKNYLIVGGRNYDNRFDDRVFECNKSPFIPWNQKLVNLFEDDLYWEFLAQNFSFVCNQQLVEKYLNSEQKLMAEETRKDKALQPTEDKLFQFGGNSMYDLIHRVSPQINVPPIGQWDISFIASQDSKLNWYLLSSCLKLDWSIELIAYFFEKWDLSNLIHNDAIKLDMPLISLLSHHKDFNRVQFTTQKVWQEGFGSLNDTEIDYVLDKISKAS